MPFPMFLVSWIE